MPVLPAALGALFSSATATTVTTVVAGVALAGVATAGVVTTVNADPSVSSAVSSSSADGVDPAVVLYDAGQ